MNKNENLYALEALGKRIRSLRVEQRLSRAQLADSLGISARYLGEIEAGKRNLSFGVLSALGRRLAIPLSELVSLEDTASRQQAIRQINAALEKMPLAHLLFIQRALRQLER